MQAYLCLVCPTIPVQSPYTTTMERENQMKQLIDVTKRGIISIVFLLGLICLLQLPAYGAEAKSQFVSKSFIEYASDSNPIKNKKALQSRLGISKERAQAIIVGKKGKKRVNKFLANDVGRAEFKCTSHGCSCHGDDDCNLMFTTVCSDTASNGSCTGDVCTCTP